MNHTQVIQEIIEKIRDKQKITKADYYEPIKDYYDNLSEGNKKQFKKELIGLLDVAEYRAWVISICRDLYLIESAEKIYQFAINDQFKNSSFSNAIIALGVLRYTKAKDFIKFCLDSLKVKDVNTMHDSLLGLIPIDPEESIPYLKDAIISDSKVTHIHNGNYFIPDILGALKKPPDEARKIKEEYDRHPEFYAMIPTKKYLQYLLQAGGKRAIYKLAKELRSADMQVKEYFVRQLSYAIDWVKNGWLPLEGPTKPFRCSKWLFLNNVKLIAYTFKQLLEVRMKETLSFTSPKK